MISLLYWSRTTARFETSAFFITMATLLNQCLDLNVRIGVTGVLSFHSGMFLQVLEGPETAVDTTFARISGDPRHHDLHVLARTPIQARAFGAWSMAFVGPPANVVPLFDCLEMSGRTRSAAVCEADPDGPDARRLNQCIVGALTHGMLI